VTDEEWSVLHAYVRDCADRLGLRDWTLVIRHDPPDEEDALADTLATEGRRRAVIRFCENFRELDVEEQRNTVVHELLHCHLYLIENAQSDGEVALGRDTAQILHNSVRRSIELACDSIATAIDEHFPLIAWDDGPKRTASRGGG